MHTALSSCSRRELLQFSSWLKKYIGYYCRRSAFSQCALPPSQRIKLSTTVRLFWTRRIHTMLLKALIIKPMYVSMGFIIYEKFFSFSSFFHTSSHLSFLFVCSLRVARYNLHEDHPTNPVVHFHLWIFWRQHESSALVCVYVNYVPGDSVAVQLRVNDKLWKITTASAANLIGSN